MSRHTLYNTKAWQLLRETYLAEHPLCEICEGAGEVVAASVVHHRIAHRGDAGRFFDPDNLAALCPACHDTFGQEQDLYGHHSRVGVDGAPLDPEHPWNKT